MQKKLFDKTLQEMNAKIKDMEVLLREREKEVKIQALKIKELMRLDNSGRKKVIKRDHDLLQQLSSPNINLQKNTTISKENKETLELQRELHLKYGRINPSTKLRSSSSKGRLLSKPSASSHAGEDHDPVKMLPALKVKKSSLDTSLTRSRSVDPAAKKKHMSLNARLGSLQRPKGILPGG